MNGFREGIAGFALLATIGWGTGVHAQTVFEETHTLSRNGNSVEQTFQIAAPGEYEVRMTDFAAPGAFTSLRLIVSRGTQLLATVDAAGTPVRFTTIVGTHRVHVVGTPNGTSGTFGVDVVPVGGGAAALQYAGAINLPGPPPNPNVSTFEADFTVTAGGTQEVRLTDFAFPAALPNLLLNVAAGGVSVVTAPAPGAYTFNATPGNYRLSVVSAVDPVVKSGSYGVQVRQGTQVLYSTAQVVNAQTGGGSSSQPGHTYEAEVATAGTYKVSLTDFQFPAVLQSLSLNVTQHGSSVGMLTSPSTVMDVPLTAGKVYLSAIAQTSSSTANSLFGLRLAPAAGGAPIVDVTQGVGPLFDARTIEVTEAGSYRVVLADLGFPASFSQLQLAVTRGTDLIGSLFGGGAFNFPATPGRYFLNFIAAPGATTQAGTYGMTVAPTPPAPTVILNANPSIVDNDTATTLNWSSTDATSCTATGAWSGSKTAAGSESSGRLTGASTFKLTCTGPGGSTEKTATVNIAPPKPAAGGGGFDWLTLLGLLLMPTLVRSLNMRRARA